jgi:hypothetical protein
MPFIDERFDLDKFSLAWSSELKLESENESELWYMFSSRYDKTWNLHHSQLDKELNTAENHPCPGVKLTCSSLWHPFPPSTFCLQLGLVQGHENSWVSLLLGGLRYYSVVTAVTLTGGSSA